ncbi:hypothetical protein G7Y89_g11808 [Cudoniella acicularis]|uniref:Uncharacterized protein n=1 Tax=Cudoniella acicularis TaxID=354080 RepID=A0A8H4RCS7_9HELO|nr:hypothetical protein G7Y89_g11808 [Cudoniella acicularis]
MVLFHRNVRADVTSSEMIGYLAKFKGLETLYIAEAQMEDFSGEVKPQLPGSDPRDPGYKRRLPVNAATIEQINRMRAKLGEKAIRSIKFVYGQRKRQLGRKWGVDVDPDVTDCEFSFDFQSEYESDLEEGEVIWRDREPYM